MMPAANLGLVNLRLHCINCIYGTQKNVMELFDLDNSAPCGSALNERIGAIIQIYALRTRPWLTRDRIYSIHRRASIGALD